MTTPAESRAAALRDFLFRLEASAGDAAAQKLLDDNPDLEQLLQTIDRPQPHDRAGELVTAADLTAQEARDLADELGTELYRAQDALAFVEECCVIADREGHQPTTDDVREWLKGARCGRQLLADARERTVLRDRIAEALYERDRPTGTRPWADAVAATRAVFEQQADAVLAVLPASVDRADVLREEADALERANPDSSADFSDGVDWAVAELRRVAAETPNTEAEPECTCASAGDAFVPAGHYRGRDDTDYCVHAIPVGPDSCHECRELAAAEQPTAGPTAVDEVVAALQAKAQALSVEAEEEMRRDLEDQAQVWHEAAEMARRTGRKAQRRAAAPSAGGVQQPKEDRP